MFDTYYIVFVLLLSTRLSTAQLSNGIGVASLGRTLFQPPCCYACLSSFWSLELSCSQTKGKGTFSINSPQCHASNKPYLASLAYCMQQKCAIDDVAISQISQCWNEVAGDGASVSSFENNLPGSPPTNELSYDATSLSGIMLVNDGYYLDSRNTLGAYAGQEGNHARYRCAIS
jgi:hypothetical protein